MMNPDKELEDLMLVRVNLILSEKNDSFRMICAPKYADWEDKMYICKRLYSLDAMMSMGLSRTQSYEKKWKEVGKNNFVCIKENGLFICASPFIRVEEMFEGSLVSSYVLQGRGTLVLIICRRKRIMLISELILQCAALTRINSNIG